MTSRAFVGWNPTSGIPRPYLCCVQRADYTDDTRCTHHHGRMTACGDSMSTRPRHASCRRKVARASVSLPACPPWDARSPHDARSAGSCDLDPPRSARAAWRRRSPCRSRRRPRFRARPFRGGRSSPSRRSPQSRHPRPAAAIVVPPDTLYVCVSEAGGQQTQTSITFDKKVGELCRRHPEMGPCQYERNMCRRSGGRVYAANGAEITRADRGRVRQEGDARAFSGELMQRRPSRTSQPSLQCSA